MKTHLDVEKGNFVIHLIRPELMLKGKSDLWVINAMKIGEDDKKTTRVVAVTQRYSAVWCVTADKEISVEAIFWFEFRTREESVCERQIKV